MGCCFNLGTLGSAITMSRKEGDYVMSFLKHSPPFLFSCTYFEHCVSFEVSVICFLGMEMVLVS
jgi:hypothetical protein